MNDEWLGWGEEVYEWLGWGEEVYEWLGGRRSMNGWGRRRSMNGWVGGGGRVRIWNRTGQDVGQDMGQDGQDMGQDTKHYTLRAEQEAALHLENLDFQMNAAEMSD